MPYGDCICEVPGCIGPCVTRAKALNEAPQCEHNWIVDYQGDPDVHGVQMFFGYCTKCGASSDSPRA